MKHLLLTLLLCLGTATAGAQSGVYGDITGDGTVDTQDLNVIINIILGRQTNPPSGTGIAPVDSLISNMVAIEGGTFRMGCANSDEDPDFYSDEAPVRMITISNFHLSRYEVTQALWNAVIGDDNPSEFIGNTLPVHNVSYDNCLEFIARLNALTGLTFRLPTEAEWEYAARGGNISGGYKYAGDNDLGLVAWYGGNSNHTPHPVGQRQPNELGLYDMSGNVMEWCADRYGTYDSTDLSDPQGPTEGGNRVFRGGSWPMVAASCRNATRLAMTPTYTSNALGFRLAR